jgi:UDP-N-acetylmuramoyl-tripeptide--D-alanyl-D-alanine ligase
MNLYSLNKFQSISIDTRTLQKGDVFVAICGPNFDGHNFVLEAEHKGAIALIVSREVKCTIPTIKVPDTLVAFSEIAALRRKQVDIPIIALTGSCGKTTTKTMLTSILMQCGDTLATEANLNNNIGVPLTLLRLKPEHEFAVLEVGANMVHEIAYSAKLIKPNVAMIINAAPMHLAGFGDLDGVARVKGDILRELRADGVAVLNADDQYFKYWQNLLQGQKFLSFGIQNSADVTADSIVVAENGNTKFKLKMPTGEMTINLRAMGEHNVKNAIAAATAAYTVGASAEAIKIGLECAQQVARRMIRKNGLKRSIIIDDSYNACPVSMRAAMHLLMKGTGEKIFVVGDMGELGKVAEQCHRDLGVEAKALGINKLYAIGELTRLTIEAFGEGARHFVDREELINVVKEQLKSDVTVLVKGSKLNHLWEVVDDLCLE